MSVLDEFNKKRNYAYELPFLKRNGYTAISKNHFLVRIGRSYLVVESKVCRCKWDASVDHYHLCDTDPQTVYMNKSATLKLLETLLDELQ